MESGINGPFEYLILDTPNFAPRYTAKSTDYPLDIALKVVYNGG
jgi:hypothetical protein